MVAALALLFLIQSPDFSQATISGVVVTDFFTPQGLVRIYLPDDVAAGDTVSGTVYIEPGGATEVEKGENLKLLQGVAVSIDGDAARVTGTRLVVRGLDKAHRLQRAVKVRVTSDGPEFSAPLHVGIARTDVPLRFTIPDISPAGRPVLIVGPFDGDTTNTRVDFGGKDAVVLAETPRGCVVQIDASYVGRRTLVLNEGGEQITRAVVLPRLTLSAPKTTLGRGERTTLTVRVTGLEGLGASAFPIPIELTNRSPSVIELGGPINFAVESRDVRNGEWTRAIDVVAKGQGGYVVTGLLFAVPLHDAKRTMTPTEFNAWLAALRTMTAEDLRMLEMGGGSQSSIEEKKRMVSTIDAFSGVSDSGAQMSAAVAIDKLLVDQSLPSLGRAMAEMGLRSISSPATVTTLVRGMKAMARKLPRAMAALDRAEKLAGEIASSNDAAEKVNRSAELRVALESAQAAFVAGE